ncbi:MAG TPA: hypothetical protein PKY40_13315 [Burkholderiaceae bacterium]|nr:hypothetical protein [Burkholderiaceae bacterium]
MWKRIIPLLWVAGILLPVAYIVQYWPPARQAFDWVFGPLWMHVLTHAFLFAALAYLAAATLGWPLFGHARWPMVLGVLGLVLAAALLQEGIQLAYKARPVMADDVLDIGVDLAGGLVGLGLYLLRQGPLRGLAGGRR